MKVNKVSRPKGLSANVTDNDGRHFVRLSKTKDKTQYIQIDWLSYVHLPLRIWQTQITDYFFGKLSVS